MKSLALENGWTGGQYNFFRVLLGIYMLIHFVQLLPWSAEVFSAQGMLAQADISPLLHVIPNIFILNDNPLFIQAVIISAAGASLAFIIGIRDKIAAFWIMYVLACLFGRNPLIANPALPYLGFMLMAHIFIPSVNPTPSDKGNTFAVNAGWVMPKDVFMASWFILALSYSYSGYTKLLSPSWVTGDNINYVLNNPLARDYFLRDFLLWLPPIFLKITTWGVLYIELLFAPLALIPKIRPVMWGLMALIQIGFASLLNFFDLTAVMLLFHLFTFDPAWIKSKNPLGKSVLFYDGQCGFCHNVVRFLLAEDGKGEVLFSPLQGPLFQQSFDENQRQNFPDSIVLKTSDGKIFTKSAAVVILMHNLGGIWLPLSHIIGLVPPTARDLAYSAIGRIRNRIFPKPANLCPIVSPAFKARFID